MGNYKKKIRVLLPPSTFYNKIQDLENPRDRAYNILLYYLGCRCTEGRNLTFEDITHDPDQERILIQIHRLKGSKQTPPNPLYFDSPFIHELKDYLLGDRMGKIFPFCRATAYTVVKNNMGWYPHYYRMNRFSQFAQSGKGFNAIRNWFGVGLDTIDYYMVELELQDMGKGLKWRNKIHAST